MGPRYETMLSHNPEMPPFTMRPSYSIYPSAGGPRVHGGAVGYSEKWASHKQTLSERNPNSTVRADLYSLPTNWPQPPLPFLPPLSSLLSSSQIWIPTEGTPIGTSLSSACLSPSSSEAQSYPTTPTRWNLKLSLTLSWMQDVLPPQTSTGGLWVCLVIWTSSRVAVTSYSDCEHATQLILLRRNLKTPYRGLFLKSTVYPALERTRYLFDKLQRRVNIVLLSVPAFKDNSPLTAACTLANENRDTTSGNNSFFGRFSRLILSRLHLSSNIKHSYFLSISLRISMSQGQEEADSK